MNKMCHRVVMLKTAITWRKHNQSINQSVNQKIWLLLISLCFKHLSMMSLTLIVWLVFTCVALYRQFYFSLKREDHILLT